MGWAGGPGQLALRQLLSGPPDVAAVKWLSGCGEDEVGPLWFGCGSRPGPSRAPHRQLQQARPRSPSRIQAPGPLLGCPSLPAASAEHRLGACPLPARELVSPGPAQSLVQASVSSLHPSQQMRFSCPAGGRTPARKPGWCPGLARPGISPPLQLRPGHSSPTSPTFPPLAPSCPERTLEFSHHVPFRACVEMPPQPLTSVPPAPSSPDGNLQLLCCSGTLSPVLGGAQ